jgi:hypothetical protein
MDRRCGGAPGGARGCRRPARTEPPAGSWGRRWPAGRPRRVAPQAHRRWAHRRRAGGWRAHAWRAHAWRAHGWLAHPQRADQWRVDEPPAVPPAPLPGRGMRTCDDAGRTRQERRRSCSPAKESAWPHGKALRLTTLLPSPAALPCARRRRPRAGPHAAPAGHRARGAARSRSRPRRYRPSRAVTVGSAVDEGEPVVVLG